MASNNKLIIIGGGGSGGVFTGLNGQTITGDANGAWTITTNGTNQNITLTPSGTGQVVIANGSAAKPGLVFAGGTTTGFYSTGDGSLKVSTAGVLAGFIARNSAGGGLSLGGVGTDSNIYLAGNTILGGLTTNGTGVLQFPAATTNAGGWNMGTDVFGYRESASTFVISTTGTNTTKVMSATNALNFYLYESTSTLAGAITSNSGAVTLRSIGGSLALYSNNTQAAIFDTAQNLTLAANLISSTSTKTGAGALAVTSTTSKYTTAGVADAITLADGANGQIKIVILDVLTTGGDSAVLTPTTKTGYTTITFSAAGQSAVLQFVTTRGWIILALRGAVAA